jgi:hypothetical protein
MGNNFGGSEWRGRDTVSSNLFGDADPFETHYIFTDYQTMQQETITIIIPSRWSQSEGCLDNTDNTKINILTGDKNYRHIPFPYIQLTQHKLLLLLCSLQLLKCFIPLKKEQESFREETV